MGDAYSAIGALADPLRRRLYDAVRERTDGLGREEAARIAQVPPHSPASTSTGSSTRGCSSVELPAADRSYRPGCRPPGERLPPRRHRGRGVRARPAATTWSAHVLAAAVERSLTGTDLPDALAEEARAAGRRDGTSYDGGGAVSSSAPPAPSLPGASSRTGTTEG